MFPWYISISIHFKHAPWWSLMHLMLTLLRSIASLYIIICDAATKEWALCDMQTQPQILNKIFNYDYYIYTTSLPYTVFCQKNATIHLLVSDPFNILKSKHGKSVHNSWKRYPACKFPKKDPTVTPHTSLILPSPRVLRSFKSFMDSSKSSHVKTHLQKEQHQHWE